MRAAFFCLVLAAFAQDKENVALPSSPEDLARGKKLYLGSCTYCHGPTGDGGKGADLSRLDGRPPPDALVAMGEDAGDPDHIPPLPSVVTRVRALLTDAVSHGAVPARFNQINVINTGRKA